VRTLFKNPELDCRWRRCEGLRRTPAIDNLASIGERDQLEETDETKMLARSVGMVGTERKREEEGQAEEGPHCCRWSRRVISWCVLLCRLRCGSFMKRSFHIFKDRFDQSCCTSTVFEKRMRCECDRGGSTTAWKTRGGGESWREKGSGRPKWSLRVQPRS
jgi:hypothetical protein